MCSIKRLMLTFWLALGFQLILMILYTEFVLLKTNLNPNSAECNCTNNVAQSQNSSVSSIPPNEVSILIITKRILSREILRSTGNEYEEYPNKNKVEFTFLLRKLIFFSVREVNRIIQKEACTKWWVNPLSVTEVIETKISSVETVYKLTYEIQPGNIPFESIVRWRKASPNSTHPYMSDEIKFIRGGRLDSYARKFLCGPVSEDLRKYCLCQKETLRASRISEKLREKWNQSDPELLTWPPFVPMFVPDYINYGNMKLYKLTPNKNVNYCGPSVKMILCIASAPAHLKERVTIRRTYGQYDRLETLGVRMLFFFGRVKNKTLHLSIKHESAEYGDIVQADYEHNYHNLTLRFMSMINWVVTHCNLVGSQRPRWILKADDDYLVNVPFALRIAEANPEIEAMGCLYCGTKPVRRLKGIYVDKYIIPWYLYLPEWYPAYLSGSSSIIRTDIFELLLEATSRIPIIHLDDVFLGLLYKEIGIRVRNSPFFVYQPVEPNPCKMTHVVSLSVEDTDDMIAQWNLLSLPPIIRECKFNASLKVEEFDEFYNLNCL